jgi:hypothetical protein
MLPILAVAFVLGLWWFTRQSELFCVSVRHGKALVVRGRVPGGLLADIRGIVRTESRSGTIRAMKSERGARLVFSGGLGEHQEQRLRNTFSLYPASQLRHAPKIAQPSVGQLLGVAWLAWLLDRRL